MNKMILYKEWLKSRWILLGLLLLFAALGTHCLLNLAKVVEFRGAAMLWTALLGKETILIDTLYYLPPVAGLGLALAQFLPEVQHKRLKLTLHLPYPQGRMIVGMALYGMLALALLFGLQTLSFVLVFRSWFVGELIGRVLLSALVWYLAGWAVYLLTAAACIEPTWRLRVVYLILGAAFLHLCYLSGIPEAYNAFLPGMAVTVLLSGSLLFLSVARFKEGVQD